MRFADFVCFEATIVELQADSRNAVIEKLISALDKAGKLGSNNAKKIAQAIIKRENEASTGMGRGISVPHVKHSAVKEVVAVVGKSDGGIDFAALDKQPVYSVILLVSPTGDAEKHLQAMECIFKHLQKEKFRKFLRQLQTTEAIEDLLREADDNPSL